MSQDGKKRRPSETQGEDQNDFPEFEIIDTAREERLARLAALTALAAMLAALFALVQDLLDKLF